MEWNLNNKSDDHQTMYHQVKFVIWFPIVIVTAFAAGYLFWQKTLIPGPYDLEPVSVVRHQTIENQTAESLDTSDWQTYRNEEYGFEFRYPKDWGDVVEKPGNRSKEGNYGCNYIGGPYGIPVTLYLYDKELTFSNTPTPLDTKITILGFNSQNPILRYCDEEGSKINVVQDKTDFSNLPSLQISENGFSIATTTNEAGIKMLYYPAYFTSIDTSVSDFYKFYHGNLEIEVKAEYIPMAYTPEGNEIEKFTNECSTNTKYNDCGIIKWVRDGKTATKVRESFLTFDQILSTFKFIAAETQKGQENGKGDVCIQVITPAKNPQTGEIRDFPTPCDVPEGWLVIK